MMDEICSLINGIKPTLMMIVVQVVYAAVVVLYKLAANDGMSSSIIVAYRYIFGAAFMVPLALFLERKSIPKLNLTILFQGFLCSLFGGSLYQYLFLESLALTSATFVTAMCNLIPAVTFILAISFGLEKVASLRTLPGKAKVLGTLIGIGGAMTLTFYKGVEIKIWSTNVNLLRHGALQHSDSSNKSIFGCLLALASCFSHALWLIVQAKMSEQFPCKYSSNALMCLMAAIQSTVFALCKEKDWSQWKLGFNIKLLTVAFSGIFSSGLIVTIIFWCVKIRGPLFVSVFNPLMLVIVALVGSLILDESLHLGSILGATLIVCGLYVVLWGKGKEMKMLVPSESSTIESETTEIVINSPTDYMSSNNNDYKNNIIIIDGDQSSNENEEKKKKYRGKINVHGDLSAKENEE